MLLERARTAYAWASALMLVLLLALLAGSLWHHYAAQRALVRYYGPDANGDRVPDRLEGLYANIEDPRARQGVRLLVRALGELITPDNLDDSDLRLVIFDYYTALDCLYQAYGDGLDRVEQTVLAAMLTEDTLRQRYRERTSRALELDLVPDFAPGLLCPF